MTAQRALNPPERGLIPPTPTKKEKESAKEIKKYFDCKSKEEKMTFFETVGVVLGSGCLIVLGVIVGLAFREGLIRSFDDTIY